MSKPVDWLNVGWVDPDAYVAQSLRDGWTELERSDLYILLRTAEGAYNLLSAVDVTDDGRWLLSVSASIRAMRSAIRSLKAEAEAEMLANLQALHSPFAPIVFGSGDSS